MAPSSPLAGAGNESRLLHGEEKGVQLCIQKYLCCLLCCPWPLPACSPRGLPAASWCHPWCHPGDCSQWHSQAEAALGWLLRSPVPSAAVSRATGLPPLPAHRLPHPRSGTPPAHQDSRSWESRSSSFWLSMAFRCCRYAQVETGLRILRDCSEHVEILTALGSSVQ